MKGPKASLGVFAAWLTGKGDFLPVFGLFQKDLLLASLIQTLLLVVQALRQEIGRPQAHTQSVPLLSGYRASTQQRTPCF